MAARCWRRVGDAFELFVRVSPGASRDAIEDCVEDAAGRGLLRVRVRSQPEKGKANAALIKLLAKALGVSKSAISVEKGETQRLKTVRIRAEGAIAQALEQLAGASHDGSTY